MSAALGLGARIVLAAVFVYAAIAKLRARRSVDAFVDAVLPRGLPIARAIPFLELALAAWLLLDRTGPVAAIATGVVLLAFTIVLVRAEMKHVPCPCFGAGPSTRPVGPEAVVRNGVLLALTIAASLDATGARLLPSLLAVAGLGAVTLAVVLRAR